MNYRTGLRPFLLGHRLWTSKAGLAFLMPLPPTLIKTPVWRAPGTHVTLMNITALIAGFLTVPSADRGATGNAIALNVRFWR